MKLVWIVLAVVILVSCSSQSDVAELKQAHDQYLGHFVRGESEKVFEMLSERCRDKTDLETVKSTSEDASKLFADIKVIDVDAKVDGDQGTVDATYDVAAFNDGEPKAWTKEDGKWKWDAC